MTDDIYRRIVEEVYEYRRDHGCQLGDLGIILPEDDYEAFRRRISSPTEEGQRFDRVDGPVILPDSTLDSGEIEIRRRDR